MHHDLFEAPLLAGGTNMDVDMDVHTHWDTDPDKDWFIVPPSPPQKSRLYKSRKFMWCLEKPQ